MDEMKNSDKVFFNYIKDFLEKKGILYHINYNIVSEDFNGYIKDINESKTLQNSSQLSVNLIDCNFIGNGVIIAPKSLTMKTQSLDVKISKDLEMMHLKLKEFESLSTFESKTTYKTSAKVFNTIVNLVDKTGKKLFLDIDELNLNFASDTQDIKARFDTSSAFKQLLLKSDNEQLKTNNFNYDVVFYDIEKDTLEELNKLLSQSQVKNNFGLILDIKNSFLKLASKGLKIDINNFSLENIEYKNEAFDGFIIKSKFHIKEDNNLVNKISYSPMLIMQSIAFDFNLKLSEKLFDNIASTTPLAIFAKPYAKKELNFLIFNSSFHKGEFKINGKSLLN